MTELGGRWLAAEADDELRRCFPAPGFDDTGWAPLEVPGHWQDEPAFAASAGPLLYRRAFDHVLAEGGRRAWMVMEGVFYQSDVWLDGSYLGDTEGYFFPHAFDVSEQLSARQEHVLGVEVTCPAPRRDGPAGALTGVFGDARTVGERFNPGGIWAPVRLTFTGPVHIGSLRVACPQAAPEGARLELVAVLDSVTALNASISTQLRDDKGQTVASSEQARPLAVGANHLRWRLEVPEPRLWWPVGLGGQPLYQLTVTVSADGLPSDDRTVLTGLRTVRMRDFVWRVNGERLFLKGADLAPTQRYPGRASAAQVEADVGSAVEAGLNMLRVRGHVGRPELYSAADRLGVLLWQDMPLHGEYKGVRSEAVRQAGAAVGALGHHPSLALWCGHDEPFKRPPRWRPSGGRSALLRRALAHALPNRDKSVLDRSLRRALQRADPSRPSVPHSGVLPHPAWGSGAHLFFGWYDGQVGDLPRALRSWPAVGRFVSELGAQAVPYSADFMGPERWPALDWAALEAEHGFDKPLFEHRLPPEGSATFEQWRDSTQRRQASLVKAQVEALRLLKYRPVGGFAVLALNDCHEAVGFALLDHQRTPKQAWAALRQACTEVLVVASPWADEYAPGQDLALDVHVVNDRRAPLADGTLRAKLGWPGGGRSWCWAGGAGADGCARVGRLEARLPGATELGGAGPWPLTLTLELSWPDGRCANAYAGTVSSA